MKRRPRPPFSFAGKTIINVKCLVTGASGFIGRQLCQVLGQRGDELVPLSLHGAALAGGQPTRAVDLTGKIPRSLFEGVDTVFHLAAVAHQHATASAHDELNHQATVALARQAAAAGVVNFVFLSSVKAMGDALTTAARREQDVVLPTHPYGLSKWRAECALREEFAHQPMSITIVRPALVYGANAKGNLATLARGARRGMPRPPQIGRRSLIGCDDLVDLLLHVAAEQGQHTWIATGEDLSTREIYDTLRAAMGKRPAKGWLPLWGWQLLARVMDGVSLLGRQSTFDKLFGTELYDNSAVIAATGWRPRQRLSDCAPRIVSQEPS